LKLIDILAGTKGEPNPKDDPSGVKITFEPSVGLLESIEAFAKETKCTLEQASATLVALGDTSKKAIKGFFGAVADAAKKTKVDEADFRVQELRLTEAAGKKDGFEEAAKACDAIAARRSEVAKAVAEQCASTIRDLKREFVKKAMERLKAKPGFFEGNRLVRALEVVAGSEEAAKIECEDPESGVPGRRLRTNLRDLAATRVAFYETLRPGPEDLAKLFHEIYEQLAPDFGYETREASRKPWHEVPENNRKLMTAVCERILRVV